MDNSCDRVEIRSIGDSSIFTKILINGHELKSVRSYKLEQVAGNKAKLTLDFSCVIIAVDQPVELWDKNHDCGLEITYKIPELNEAVTEELEATNKAYRQACEQDLEKERKKTCRWGSRFLERFLNRL